MAASGAPVITRLSGGLGNQLFQYAAGKALAEHLGAPLLIDHHLLDYPGLQQHVTPRAYALGAFRIPDAVAGDEVVREWARRTTSGRILRLWQRIAGGVHILRERDIRYDPRLLQQRAPVLLVGHWQCEGYFAEIAERLRHEWLLPVDAPAERNQDMAARIAACRNPASVHVRLGDYVHHARTAAYHGALDPEHYQRAARALLDRAEVDHFFVFSDEPERASERLDLPRPMTIVSHNTGPHAHWDLWLMRQCRHHVIANSSFSWWGAWLNNSNEKVVVAPQRWFADATIRHDILPPAWIAV